MREIKRLGKEQKETVVKVNEEEKLRRAKAKAVRIYNDLHALFKTVEVKTVVSKQIVSCSSFKFKINLEESTREVDKFKISDDVWNIINKHTDKNLGYQYDVTISL